MRDWRFVRDDSCHWYIIPEDEYDLFNEWVEDSDGINYDGPDFDQYRSDDPTRYILRQGSFTRVDDY